MARISEVQYNQVEQACVSLFKAGESVSFAKVYQAIGSKGGQQVVSDMIRRWRQETAAAMTAKRENPALPEALVTASDALVGDIWKLALVRSEEVYQEKVAALGQKEQEWSAKIEAADERVRLIERDLLALQAELASTRATRDAAEKAVSALTTRTSELQAAIDSRDMQISNLREDNARAMTTLEAERVRHDDHVRALQEQHTLEVAQLHTQADGDRRHFMQQTDDLRQAHRLQAENLKAQLEGLQIEAETFKRQAFTARDEAAQWRGKFEHVQDELAEARKIIAKVQKHREKVTKN